MGEYATPFSTAWETWAVGDGATALSGIADGKYLRNRLHCAFSAGWCAAIEARRTPPPAADGAVVTDEMVTAACNVWDEYETTVQAEQDERGEIIMPLTPEQMMEGMRAALTAALLSRATPSGGEGST